MKEDNVGVNVSVPGARIKIAIDEGVQKLFVVAFDFGFFFVCSSTRCGVAVMFANLLLGGGVICFSSKVFVV